MSQGYALNFVIPQGPTGPTGPTGSDGINVYGGRYNNTTNTISLAVSTQSQVPLSVTMPNQNTTYIAANSITVSQGGIYEINYYINLSVALAASVTMAVRNNGTNIASTVTTRNLSVGIGAVYSGTTIVNLTAGNVLDLAISAPLAVTITLGSGTNAILTVKKIS